MGLLGRRVLKDGGFIIVRAGYKHPMSCIVDGLQVSSGCTVGRGKMIVIGSEEVSALVKGAGGAFEIRLKDKVLAELLESTKSADSEDMEILAYKIIETSVEDLFTIRRVRTISQHRL